ncbi:hypothetical protein D3C85_875660 [compost metagenome]
MNINESALNDAGWVLHDELKKLMGEVPAKVFNNLKPALQVALECYQKKSAEETAIKTLQNDLDVPWAIAERAFRLGYRKP